MNKEDLIKLYEECKVMTKEHEKMLDDFHNRIPRVKNSPSTEELAMEFETADEMAKRIEKSQEELDQKLKILEQHIESL